MCVSLQTGQPQPFEKRTSHRAVLGVPDVEMKGFAFVRFNDLLETLRVDGLRPKAGRDVSFQRVDASKERAVLTEVTVPSIPIIKSKKTWIPAKLAGEPGITRRT